MKFHFLTIFPQMIEAYIGDSILAKATAKGLLEFAVEHIRAHSMDKHHKTDDRPYGGGPGMVMNAEPILRSFSALRMKGAKTKVIMLSPSGKLFTNTMAKKLAKQYSDIVFICGRYEGVDDRVRKALHADEVSVGDFILTGGELPALTITDAVARQIPGVLGDTESIEEKRTASPRVYTRPEVLIWQGKQYKVPPILLSGDHKRILAWRKEQKGK